MSPFTAIKACISLAALALAGLAQGAVTRGPYLQLSSSNSIVIKWRTDVAQDSRVRYGASFAALSSTVQNGTLLTDHEITLSGLAPDSLYYYAVGHSSGDLAGADANHRFRTHPLPGSQKNARIWVLGDAGTAGSAQRSVRDAYLSYSAANPADLVLQLGDNAYASGLDGEYQVAMFQNMYENQIRNTVFWSTLGNHETYGGGAYPYWQIFALPTAGQAGGLASGTESYYSFDYGRIHFVCLDSMDSSRAVGGAQYLWLDADLSATTQDWIIVYFHHPPYTSGSHDSDNAADSGGRMRDMRQNFLPLLESHGVDLVLTGHSHSYERSQFINGHYGLSSTFNPATHVVQAGNGREGSDGAYLKASLGPLPNAGAVYAVAGSSGQISGVTLRSPHYIALNELGSMILDVSQARLDARFVNSAGIERDWFTLLKGPQPTPTPSITPTPYAGTPTSSPTATPSPIVIQAVPVGTVWKYHDQGVDLGGSWRTAGYDDSAWASGVGPLGYNDAWVLTTLSYGGVSTNKYPSYYFRRNFSVVDAAQVIGMILRVNYDDGFVAYINGSEVARSNMAAGAVSYSSLASPGTHEGVSSTALYENIDLAAFLPLLVNGNNILQVEVHQRTVDSSDLTWDGELLLTLGLPLATASASPTPSPSFSPSPAYSATMSPTASLSATPSLSPTPCATPSSSVTASVSSTPSASKSPSPSSTPSPSETAYAGTPTETAISTFSPTLSSSSTRSASPTRVNSPSSTQSPTQISSPSSTQSPTQISSPSSTQSPTQISSPSPSATVLPSISPSPTTAAQATEGEVTEISPALNPQGAQDLLLTALLKGNSSEIEIEIYSSALTLISRTQVSGYWMAGWNALTLSNINLPNGLYFVRARAKGQAKAQSCAVMRLR